MDSDETKFLPNTRKKTQDEPFEFGEGTILSLRNQSFEPTDEFGTMMQRPSIPLETQATPMPELPPETEAAAPILNAPVVEDPIARIEHKLDLALRQIQSLQQRLESLDATIARALLR